jgi:hypothetical protein
MSMASWPSWLNTTCSRIETRAGSHCSRLDEAVPGRAANSARRLGIAAVTLAFLVITAAATADGPYEPNDTPETATGGLIEGKTYSAAIERVDQSYDANQDVDWYIFNTGRAGTFTVSYTNRQAEGNCFGPEARLLSPDGALLGVAQPRRNETERIVYNGAAPAQYLLRVKPYQIEPCPPPEPYSFDVGPLGNEPPVLAPLTQQPHRKVKPRIKVTKARLSRTRLRLTGTLPKSASARLVSVLAKGTRRARKVSVRFRGKQRGALGWRATARLPRGLRGTRLLRYRVTYLGDVTFDRLATKWRLVRRR